MTTTTRLTGRDAIEYARARGLTLSAYADPTEGARSGLTVAEATEIAAEDPSLVYLDDDLVLVESRADGVRWIEERLGREGTRADAERLWDAMRGDSAIVVVSERYAFPADIDLIAAMSATLDATAYAPVRLTAQGEGALRDALRAAGLGVHDYVWSAVVAEVESTLTARRDAGDDLGAELRIGGRTIEYAPSSGSVE